MTEAEIGYTVAESRAHHVGLPAPPPGAPNVVVIVLDDLGFAQLGCFGSDIGTPAIDALAAGGLRYNRFHVTALCSPTRACLMTGRNHHAVGMGFLTDIPVGFPGYTGRIPPSAATLARILRDAGYSTFAVGKWHLTPRWEVSASGPFDRWPLGLGFERFYGFHGGDTNQFAPELANDNGYVAPPRTPGEGYHLTEDLADRAIRLVQNQQQNTPGKPFFLYFATGAMHAPHHAPATWIERYRGHFDEGWDSWRDRTFARQVEQGIVPANTTLTPRPSWIPTWQDCSDDERRLFARYMEAFAGFLGHTDAQIGRLLEGLGSLGSMDDTLVLLISDNGTSAEGGPVGSLNEHRFTHDRVDELADSLAHIDDIGGPRAYNHYPWAWAWAGNTPLRLWKRYTWLGGVRTPLVARWPGRIPDPGAVRPQFCHAVDLFATVLDAAGLEVPAAVGGVAQQPVDGRSLLATFEAAEAPSPRRTQYFEMLGSRAIYHDGWKATTDHVGQQISVERNALEGSHAFGTDRWHLFDLDADFAEAHDLAGAEPERARRLEQLWWAEAGRNQVLPLDDSFIGRAINMEPSPWGRRLRAALRPGGGGIAEDLLPPLGNGFRLAAAVDATGPTASGVLAALGDWNNGFALYVLRGRPVVAFSLFGDLTRIEADPPLTAGAHEVSLEYRRAPGGGGDVVLLIDGAPAGVGRLPGDLPFRWQVTGAQLRVGRDQGFPVCDDYTPPAPFEGRIREVVVEALGPSGPPPAAAEVVAALHTE